MGMSPMILGRPWTDEEMDCLRRASKVLSDAEIAKLLDRTVPAVRNCRQVKGLPSKICMGGVSRKRYVQLITDLSVERGVDPAHVLSGRRHRRFGDVRVQVWRQLRQEGASYPALAKASGYDHTTIIERLRGRGNE